MIYKEMCIFERERGKEKENEECILCGGGYDRISKILAKLEI